MPTGSLYDELQKAIDTIVEKRAGSGIAERAPIDAAGDDGSVVARVGGRPVRATMASEEPVFPGETGWVAKTKDGAYIVHGGAH